MLSKLDKEIIFLLKESQKELTSEQISFKLFKSSKTIQNHIRIINDDLQLYGARIESKKGLGYLLVIDDKEKFKKLAFNDVNDEDIVDSIIDEFIHYQGYIKADDLVKKLFISKTKLTNSLNVVRDILNKYDLKIEIKPHRGLKIVGDEFDFRRFISSIYVQRLNTTQQYNYLYETDYQNNTNTLKLYNRIYQIVENIVDEFQYSMPLYVLEGVVRHLLIMLQRIQSGKTLDWSSASYFEINDKERYLVEKELAESILNRLSEEFDISIPESEYRYIYINILSKKVLNISERQNISDDINQLVEDILFEIKECKGIDFLNDFDLRMMLGLHFVPLKIRLQYGIGLCNPLLDDIKLKCIAGYDLAIFSSSLIKKTWNYELSDHEMSYLALHFDVALNRQSTKIKKNRILIVCGSGRASAQLLKYNFMQYFSKYLNDIEVCDVADFDRVIEVMTFDYIFTTVPLDKRVSTPVFEFQFFLNESAIQQIESVLKGEIQKEDIMAYFPKSLFFSHVDVSSQHEALQYIFKTVRNVKDLPINFEEAVMEREKLSGTDLINNVALPHPIYSLTIETFIAVYILEKPILWNKNKVRLIFLISMGQQDSFNYKQLFEMLIKVLSSQNNIQQMIKKPTYQVLTEILSNSSKEGNT